MNPEIIGNKLSIQNQREKLLELNPDLLFGVYSLIEQDQNNIKLDFIDDTLTCYPNQLENISGINQNSDITIIDLLELRKGKIKILQGNNKEIVKPILLSHGVIEIIESVNKNGKTNKHVLSTLRDSGSIDNSLRTPIGGRCIGDNLETSLKREHIEESPFIGYDENGNYTLATIDDTNESKEILKLSIKDYLKNKFLNLGDKNYDIVKKIWLLSF